MSRRSRTECPIDLTEAQLRWADIVARGVAKMLPPSFELDDLRQIARIETWRKLQVFDKTRGASFTTFAFKGVRGACLMFARRRNYTASTSLPLDERADRAEEDATDTCIQAAQVRRILGTVVDELLDERERKVIILHYIRGWDVASIAEEMSCSASLIRLIRQQAHESLRKRLAMRGVTAADIGQ